jgi:hypothetical protein
MQKLKTLMNEYGPLALGVYLCTFVVAMAGFSTALAMGAQVESACGAAGTLGAAWLATKATQPLRIAATLGLTPLVAKVWRRFRPPATSPTPPTGP